MKLTIKIWILLGFVILSCLSLFVNSDPLSLTFVRDGVTINSIDVNSQLFQDGLRKDMVITEINSQTIKNTEDYANALKEYYLLKENQTIRTEIKTLKNEFIGLYGTEITTAIQVKDLPTSKLKTGLDLQGGARAFVSIEGDVTKSNVQDLIQVLEQRLNTYGLTDVNIYTIETSKETLIGIEIASSSPEELEELIEEQGHFEAKIANQSVFVGGEKDITHVARTGQEAYVYNCRNVNEGSACDFQFQISLSTQAAQRFADITNNVSTKDNCNPTIQGCYLSEQIIFYLDEVEHSSLNIVGSLKGRPETTISITGSEVGITEKEAATNAKQEMTKLQTVLITGSLPFKLNIEKIDRISPNLGQEFTKQILLGGLFAILAVTLIIFLRYKKLKISIAVILVSFSEVLIILGIASLINWNLNLPSIAGIIAAIGTGIDSQIIILDESKIKGESLKNQIKKALFIISTAFATTLVALLPLTGWLGWLGIGATSAGLLKGFAVTTLIGISVGVFISRPAFADIIKQIQEN